MKRLLATMLVLCTVVMLVIAPLTTASAATTRNYQYVNSYKNGQLVRLRPEPNMNNKEITKLAHRAYVLVYEYNKQRTWAYIEAENPDGPGTVKGWISAEFLSKKDPGNWKAPTQPDVDVDVLATLSAISAKIKPVAEPYAAEITTRNPTALVHLRWFPDTGAKYLDAFPRGTAVTVIAQSKTWTQVIYTPADTEEMHVGFVLTDNVTAY